MESKVRGAEEMAGVKGQEVTNCVGHTNGGEGQTQGRTRAR